MDWFTRENIELAVLIISIIVTIIIELRRRGLKGALLGVMRTIEKTKVDQETPEKIEAAITIAKEIQKDWNKDSKIKAIQKTAELIDDIYHEHIKPVSKWIDEHPNDIVIEK